MKKHGIINSEISSVLSYMGHKDQICIGDAGLPIPSNVKRIDLSIKPGFPKFITVLRAVLDDMHVEKVYLAEEIKTHNPAIYNQITEYINPNFITFITHDQFKEKTNRSKAVIRTGEITPYANIILVSNVSFKVER